MANAFTRLFIKDAPAHRVSDNPPTEERNATQAQKEKDIWFGSLNYSSSGAAVSPLSVLSVPAFYRAVQIISGVLSSMPVEVFSTSNDNSRTVFPAHPLVKLLNFRPHPAYTPYTFTETMILHLFAYGNFYAIIRRKNIDRSIISLDIVTDPNQVSAEINSRSELVYKIKQQSYSADRVLHIKGVTFDGILGEDAQILQRENFGLALAIRKYLAKFFGNGAHLSGVLTMPGALTQQIYERLVASWKARYGANGSDSGGTAILEHGTEYKPITLSPEQSSSEAMRRASIADIALITGVPRFMLEESDPTFNNGETLTRQFVNYTILPLCQRIQDEFDYKLFSTDEQYTLRAEYNLTKLLSADTEQRSKYLDSLMKWGIVTINEVRKMEGMNPSTDENANKHLIPVNMVSPDSQNNDDGDETGN